VFNFKQQVLKNDCYFNFWAFFDQVKILLPEKTRLKEASAKHI